MTNVIQNPNVITVFIMPGEIAIKTLKIVDNLNKIYGKLSLNAEMVGVKENIFENRSNIEMGMTCIP